MGGATVAVDATGEFGRKPKVRISVRKSRFLSSLSRENPQQEQGQVMESHFNKEIRGMPSSWLGNRHHLRTILTTRNGRILPVDMRHQERIGIGGGVLVYGGAGFLLDRWMGTSFMVGIGIVLGAGLGIYTVLASLRNE